MRNNYTILVLVAVFLAAPYGAFAQVGVTEREGSIIVPGTNSSDSSGSAAELRAQQTVNITRTLSRGSSGEDVRALQEFLARSPEIYPERQVTGFFGPLTEAAIQRLQQQTGVVSSGTPETTGFGVVGPRTRAVLQEVQERLGTANPSAAFDPGVGSQQGEDSRSGTAQTTLDLVLQAFRVPDAASQRSEGSSAVSMSTSESSGSSESATASVLCRSTRSLSAGEVGEAVSDLQRTLRVTGDFTFPETTGFFGQATREAVQKFQARLGIVASGTPETTGFGAVGPRTWASLCSSPDVSPAQAGTAPENDTPASEAGARVCEVLGEQFADGADFPADHLGALPYMCQDGEWVRKSTE